MQNSRVRLPLRAGPRVANRGGMSSLSHAFRRVLLGVAAVAAVVSAASPAGAYCRTTTCNKKKENCRIVDKCNRSGAPLTWKTLPIPYRFSAKGTTRLDVDEAQGSVRLAFKRWTETICPNGKRTSLRFEEKPMLAANIPRGKEPFGIYFRDDRWPHQDSEETLALTSQLFGTESGDIFYSDIEINTVEKEFVLRDNVKKGFDLEAIITHEVGHYIGLDHSNDISSIMTVSYCESDKRCEGTSRAAARDLAADDVAAVCALFPPDRPNGEEAEAPGCSASPTTPKGGEAALGVGSAVVALGFFRLVRASRRRRGAAASR